MSTFCVVSLRYSRYVLAFPKFSSAPSLTKILVRGNELGDEGATILCDALRKSTVTKVQELDLSVNRIGPEGAKAVAAMAAVVASLTKIS